MENFQKELNQSKKYLRLADHMTYSTYNLIKDNKILFAILQNIFKAMEAGMNSILEYDLLFKRIGDYPKDFKNRIFVFETKCSKRYSIKREHCAYLRDLFETIKEHKESPMVFERQGYLVICSESYRYRKISITEIKKYLSKAKVFIDQINSILEGYDRIFNQS